MFLFFHFRAHGWSSQIKYRIHHKVVTLPLSCCPLWTSVDVYFSYVLQPFYQYRYWSWRKWFTSKNDTQTRNPTAFTKEKGNIGKSLLLHFLLHFTSTLYFRKHWFQMTNDKQKPQGLYFFVYSRQFIPIFLCVRLKVAPNKKKFLHCWRQNHNSPSSSRFIVLFLIKLVYWIFYIKVLYKPKFKSTSFTKWYILLRTFSDENKVEQCRWKNEKYWAF